MFIIKRHLNFHVEYIVKNIKQKQFIPTAAYGETLATAGNPWHARG